LHFFGATKFKRPPRSTIFYVNRNPLKIAIAILIGCVQSLLGVHFPLHRTYASSAWFLGFFFNF